MIAENGSHVNKLKTQIYTENINWVSHFKVKFNIKKSVCDLWFHVMPIQQRSQFIWNVSFMTCYFVKLSVLIVVNQVSLDSIFHIVFTSTHILYSQLDAYNARKTKIQLKFNPISCWKWYHLLAIRFSIRHSLVYLLYNKFDKMDCNKNKSIMHTIY